MGAWFVSAALGVKIYLALFVSFDIQALIQRLPHPVRLDALPLQRIGTLESFRSHLSVGLFAVNRDPTIVSAQKAIGDCFSLGRPFRRMYHSVAGVHRRRGPSLASA